MEPNTQYFGLRQVYPEPGSNDTDKEVDIVAIHGLDTQSPRQWEAWKEDGDPTSGRVHWLKDVHMLPSKLTNARIYTYDWNANVDKGAAADSLFGFADQFLEALLIHTQDCNDRPLVFIASCYGGLLLARALARAAEIKSEYQPILRSTAGTIFLGTPFQGSHSTFRSAAQVRALVTANAGGQGAEELASYLKQDYKLDEVVQRFREVVNMREFNFPIVCYYETLESDFRSLHKNLPSDFPVEVKQASRGILVDKHSATLPGLKTMGLEVRHTMICKYSSPDDLGFKSISMRLKKMVVDAKITLDQKLDPKPDADANSSQKAISQSAPPLAYGNVDQVLQLVQSNESIGGKVLPSHYGSPIGNGSRLPPFLRSFEHYDYNSAFRTVNGAHCQNTYDWLFDTDEIAWWFKDDQARILWLNGDAGIGKSTITAYLINQFQFLPRKNFGIHDANPVVLHAFCHYQKNYSASMVISVLIHQLLLQFPLLAPVAYKKDIQFYLTGSQTHSTAPGKLRLARNLWLLFNDIVQETNLAQLFICVDSFDSLETTSRQELFQEMSFNFTNTSRRTVIKFFVTSRPGHDVKEWQSRWTVQRPENFRILDLAKRNDRLQKDVDRFIDLEFLRLRSLNRHLPRELDRIKEQLREDKSRNFLIATLCCKHVENLGSLEIRDIFKQISEDLDEFYRGLLSQIPPNLQESSSFVMASVAYSFKSLTIKDLALIRYYEVNHGSTRLAPRWPFQPNEDDIHLARNAVECYLPILRLSGFQLESQHGSRHVSFFHDSVRDYCIRHSTDIAPLFVPNHRAGHRRMAVICIVCILSNSQIELPSKFQSLNTTPAILSKEAFLSYACNYWHKHVLEAVPSDADVNDVDPELESALKAMICLWREPKTYRLREVTLSMIGYPSLSNATTALELLSGLGLTVFLKIYLDKQSQRFLRTNMYAKAQSAVLLAAQGGHEACFEIVLDTFGITSLDGERFKTIKADAAYANHPRILERITKMRPHSDIRELVEAVVAAFMSGDKASADKLVSDSNIRGLNHFGMNALHLLFVSQEGRTAEQDTHGSSAFYSRTTRGSGLSVIMDVAKFLIHERGISVLDTDNFGFTALHWMCYYKRLCQRSLIELLCQEGADPRSQSATGLTPLHLAAYNTDNADAIYCLLEYGTPKLIGMASQGYMTPLHWAVWNRSSRLSTWNEEGPSAVEALLRHGADWHARNARGLTPIEWAGHHTPDHLQRIYTQFSGINIIPITYPAEQLVLIWERRGSSETPVGRGYSVATMQMELHRRRATGTRRVEALANDTPSTYDFFASSYIFG